MTDDAQGEMIDLAVRLQERLAAGEPLSPEARMVADILWIDTMVSPNGFDGWLYDTSSERIAGTRKALATVGCARVAEIVERALALSGIAPESMSDGERQSLLDALGDDVREQLSDLDGEFYEASPECMAICRDFVRQHADDPALGAG